MSNSDYFATATSVTPPAPTPLPLAPAEPAYWPARSRRGLMAALLAVATRVATIGALHLRSGPHDTRPVVLPKSLAGFQPAPTPYQFAENASWPQSMAKAFGNTAYGGRAYGSLAAHQLINLVVVRADSSGFGDPSVGRPPYTMFGEVRCTHSLQFKDSSPELVDSKLLLCWRASDTLTVSAIMLLGGQGFDEDTAQAVQDVWDAQQ
jgi:hypothetical protein